MVQIGQIDGPTEYFSSKITEIRLLYRSGRSFVTGFSSGSKPGRGEHEGGRTLDAIRTGDEPFRKRLEFRKSDAKKFTRRML